MSSSLIQTLKTAAAFPHPTESIQVRETHISWVVLTGEFAYKIKKPVDFGFLDYSTLAKRKQFLELEMQLNQRLAPDFYLDVLPVSGTPEAPRIGDASEPFEYALKMRQFDDSQLLNALQQRGELKEEHLLQLAGEIADFHQQLQGQTPPEDLGTPEAIWAPAQQNFDQIRELLDDDSALQQLKRLEDWSVDTYERLQDTLAQRRAQGFVRECHGDLHLGNATLWQGRVVAFDCIEFNPGFRWCDVISDLAFLLMDLEDRGLKKLANITLNHYLEKTGDYQGLELLCFYKVYRALVRAKINLFRLGQPGLDDEEKAAVLRQYRSYTDLAESYTDFHPPYLMITYGVSGSGKSTLTERVVRDLGGIRIRSDVERKRLYNLDAEASSHSQVEGGIYTPEATEKTYQKLTDLADLVLRSCHPVTLDATNLKRAQRDRLREVAENLGLPSLIIALKANEETLRRRLIKRQQSGEKVAEADLEVLEKQLASKEPLGEDELGCAVTVDTDAPAASQTLVKLIRDHLRLDD
ncbi:AAA family ATPase [Marinospirillum perlucidum]|uniref:bifunctional aminoglycoside phosphotransferase/ATP-binding protein n=1 Tax=Marinospirillum perlucidum TaxID=1982602 RepID=UPI000DF34471|nr:bifunctional aminoglycoside phosphotransferase/ATP-binding protein [Marinospirillum perlucidum]